MSVYCECCLLSRRCLCIQPITRPEESYRVCCVLSVIVEPRTGGLGPAGLSSHEQKIGNTDWHLRSNVCLIWKALLCEYNRHLMMLPRKTKTHVT
jgi:hypothetical protein